MKFFVISFLVVVLGGCSMMEQREDSPSLQRKARLTSCVGNFLGQDVSPVDSLHICSSIFSRWEPSTTPLRGFGVEAKTGGSGE